MATTQPGIAELKIDGAFYGGWKRVRVTRSIEQMAGTFELEVTERWPGMRDASPIKPGQACQLLLDGEVVVTGCLRCRIGNDAAGAPGSGGGQADILGWGESGVFPGGGSGNGIFAGNRGAPPVRRRGQSVW